MGLKKRDGEKVDAIMGLLDEAEKQKKGKKVTNISIKNFRESFTKALDLRNELEKEEGAPYCKRHYKEMYKKFIEIIDNFVEYHS